MRTWTSSQIRCGGHDQVPPVTVMMMNLPRPCLLPSPALFQQNGYTALMLGAMEGHELVVEVLLAKGAKIDLRNKVRWP